MNFLKKLFGITSADSVQAKLDATAFHENWKTFKRPDQGGQLLILVNEELKKDKRFKSLNWLTLTYDFTNEQLANGHMPTSETIKTCYDFEDSLVSRLATVGGTIAGFKTGCGKRTVLVCSPDNRLNNISTEALASYSANKLLVATGNYLQYYDLLPTKMDEQLIGNVQILQKLAEHGDDGASPREIRHWAYAPKTLQSITLQNALKSAGYDIAESEPGKIRFSKIAILTLEKANAETVFLNKLCSSNGWEYDGWESPVFNPTRH